MKIYKNINVFDDAISRINFLFDEFENVVVGFSGGKDSTCVLNLALKVAEERNRLPLSVIWIDQEAEWQGTVDYCREVMYDPRVKPMWFQMPMVITNNASSYDRYSYCWEEGKDDLWIHPKDPISIKENNYGTNRFHDLFERIFKYHFKGQKSCYLAGVRCEESPKRAMTLTDERTYKHITWGKILNKELQHFTFYPLFDWSYSDVWKAIQSNKWAYNDVYNEMYRYGVKINDMRISNVHHETAIQALLLIQDIEPKTWLRISARINGANTIKHLKNEAFVCPKELPSMFESWSEYSSHLAKHIIQDDKNKATIVKITDKYNKLFPDREINQDLHKNIINTILSSDWDLTKLKNWSINANVNTYKKFKKGIINEYTYIYNKYVPQFKNIKHEDRRIS
jgi:predicted phosphoadenosine phosphosulfate sulfurtransferase